MYPVKSKRVLEHLKLVQLKCFEFELFLESKILFKLANSQNIKLVQGSKVVQLFDDLEIQSRHMSVNGLGYVRMHTVQLTILYSANDLE